MKAAAADDLLGRASRSTRMLVTPDGVPLRIVVPDVFERGAAFAADFVVTLVVADVVLLVAQFISGGRAGVTLAAATFIAFVVRNAYFVGFELAWSGATPGKRALGLRVIDRHGGALTPRAIVARNLTREVEIFFPLGMLLQAQQWLYAPWEIGPVALWLLLTSALPLCNRDRLRAGDLIGGTIVIAVPKTVLLDDLVADRRVFTFTGQQLDRYGVVELHVLEDVLRQSDAFGGAPLLIDIAERVKRKIGWQGALAPRDAFVFLRDFYAAQREHLELRKHLGEERPDKFYRRDAGR